MHSIVRNYLIIRVIHFIEENKRESAMRRIVWDSYFSFNQIFFERSFSFSFFEMRLYIRLCPPPASAYRRRIDDDNRIDEATSHPLHLPPRPVPIVITHRRDRKSTVKLQERSIYQSTSAPIWW